MLCNLLKSPERSTQAEKVGELSKQSSKDESRESVKGRPVTKRVDSTENSGKYDLPTRSTSRSKITITKLLPKQVRSYFFN